VARAIGTSPVPVLTGLGHEIDRSVADEVAHLALKTPTACAAVLVERVRTFRGRVEAAWAAIGQQAVNVVDLQAAALAARAARAGERTRSGLAVASDRLDRHAERLPSSARRAADASARALTRNAERLQADARRHLARDAVTLDGLEGRVRALDPARTLARGWSITRAADGRVVRSVEDVAPGEELTTTLADGQARSRVEEVHRT
jgi:exodeoxyribonuclease VII large subunit